jgi:poly(A) polymerase
VKRLRDAGHVAYFAGGCVRDLLLGLAPKDYDVATDAPPDKVRAIFRNTQAVGAAFGVILVRLNGSQIEVATFRADMEYEDGRRPVGVRFTSAEEDAKRRDFTINGLFLDPIEDRVIDYVGGREDLKAKILRAIGEPEERFREDHLRMLRAVRFAARFSLTVEGQTSRAIEHHAPHLVRISPERIAEELRLMLRPRSRIDAFVMLRSLGLLDVIGRFLPEKPSHRPDETCNMFLALGPPVCDGPITFGLALAGLTLEHRLKALGSPGLLSGLDRLEIRRSVQAMRQSLKISNEEADQMAGALDVGFLIRRDRPTVAQMKRFLASPTSSDAILLMRALQKCGVHTDDIEEILSSLDSLTQAGNIAPLPLITGDDLTAAGLKPGKLFKRILDDVYDAQLEDRISSKEDAMNMAMQISKSSA